MWHKGTLRQNYLHFSLCMSRMLERIMAGFKEGSYEHCCCCCCRFSRVWFCATPKTAVHQAPLSLGFSRQEHWSGLPFSSPMHACMLSRFWLCVTLWTAAHQAPLSMGFSRQEYWSGLPFPSPGLRTLKDSKCMLLTTGNWKDDHPLLSKTRTEIRTHTTC